MIDAWALAAGLLLGACIGSFLNVVIHRLQPEGLLQLGSRSVCPACGAPIAWFDNLPIASFLILRGRARCCQSGISWRYPLVEVLMAGAVAGSVLLREPLTDGQVDWSRMALVGIDLWFVSLVVALSFIDLRDRLLPDVLTLPGLVSGIVLSILVPAIHAHSVPAMSAGDPEGHGFMAGALGAAAGGGVIWLVAIAGKWLFKQEAMGFGDVKFMAFLGAFVGVDGVLLGFFVQRGGLLDALDLPGRLAGPVVIEMGQQSRGIQLAAELKAMPLQGRAEDCEP
jgi:leader peptidase (prepilin peptidase)/N-methyltransferase